MDVVQPRCAGIDCSKDAKVCVRVQGQGRRRGSSTVTTWGATTSQILALREHLINIGEKRADHIFDLVESLGAEEHRLVVRDVVCLNTHPADVQRPELGVVDLLDLPV